MSAPIHVTPTNSKWFLYTGSHEARHQLDLLHLNFQLINSGWQQQNIYHFIEPLPFGNTEYVRSGFPITTTSNINLLPQLTTSDTEVAVIVFSGHGNYEGVCYAGGASCVKGYDLIQTLQSAPNINSSIIINGACHSGAFKYLDVLTGKPLCILGATNFEISYSAETESVLGFFERRFESNLFLRLFSDWIVTKSDVDGDGNFTLIDAFRWSAIRTVNNLRHAKADNFKEWTKRIDNEKSICDGTQKSIKDIQQQIQKKTNQLNALPGQGHGPGSVRYQNMINEISKANNNLLKFEQDLSSADTNFKSFTALAYSRQEPWIVNTKQARLFSF